MALERCRRLGVRACADVDDAVRQALISDRIVDITTVGRRSGAPRRIEIWLIHIGGRLYLSGLPGRRDWYANLAATPRLILHLKQTVVADLPATARLVTGTDERRRLFVEITRQLGRAEELDAFSTGSPLVEVVGAGDERDALP
jgi:deazaflavin-dependent oxidoreductase (nitroreductase family)